MASRRPPGTPGKIISFIRDILVGRHVAATPWLRTVDRCSTRSPDAPNLPDGPAHKLAFNYYYTRDLRRDVSPPIVSTHKQLLMDQKMQSSPLTIPPVPGEPHK